MIKYPVNKIYTVGSKFGWRDHPVHKDKDGKPLRLFHSGVDIGCPIGTEVKAGLAGVVVRVWYDDWNPKTRTGGGGLSMRILHDNGYTSGFAHIDEAFVGPADRVAQGQTIALTGNNGVSTCPHLHYTLRDGNMQAIDPEPYFEYN